MADELQSPIRRAFDQAIESAIAGEPIYPDGSIFIDADDRGLGKAIRRAVDEGAPVVLVYGDGAVRVLRAVSTDREAQD